MKYICLLIFFILFGCYNTPDIKYLNVKNGTALAQKQDSLINQYVSGDSIPQHEAYSLENNVWFKLALETAPSNLVIRQLCLIDLISGEPKHTNQIDSLLRILSYDGGLWSEGYSYWMYTFMTVKPWVSKFLDSIDIYNIIEMVDNINNSFVITAYVKDSVWYPALYGDLRYEPLSKELQLKCIGKKMKSLKHSLVELDVSNDSNFVYKINGKAIGLNTHIPTDTFYVEMIKGMSNFTFYTGYNNKYKNKKDEWTDILSRIKK